MLNGVTLLEKVTRLQWPQIQEDDSGVLSRKKRASRDPTNLKITLAPIQIRTFITTIG